ncbi:MAG: peptidoglycan-binding protein [Eubacteriales bacterium]|nr:peptidoglycan-binding protein [Eubacteriales bacterium]
MSFKRNLSLGASGADVIAVKERLLELGCYTATITSLKRDTFGKDTRRAVLAFQAAKGLMQDGIVGRNTYSALFPEEARTASSSSGESGIPDWIPGSAAERIWESLAGETEIRKSIVLDALAFAVHPDLPGEYPRSLYIRGGNLYNADLKPNVISIARIARGAARQPEYYDGGRREMMENAVRANPAITGADCSGGIVGLLRHAKAVSSGFDCSADGFVASGNGTHIQHPVLRPGDFLHRSGHIGLYAGGGYAVEWMGGAYGCQLTELEKRRGWNYVTKRLSSFGGWKDFLRPAYYEE